MAKGGKKRGMTMRTRLLMIFGLIMAIIFMPTAIILAIGMLPTLVALITNATKAKTKVLTVGAMNLAGCMPFTLQLWTSTNTAAQSFMLITDPRTIIIMYSAAAVGYIIDWAVVGLVSSIMVQTGNIRIQHITKRQAELVERWGREVTGDIPIDRQGFPYEPEDGKDRGDL